jgi:hypothetical protein
MNWESLRRVLPYTAGLVGLAAIYTGLTMYSRYTQARDSEKQIKDREAAINQRIVDVYGGDRLTILTFAAEPPEVPPGGKVEMCYGVSNATVVKIEPDIPPIKPAVTHCLEVFPKRTTRYTLTAEDARGNRKQQGLTIQVVERLRPAPSSPAP